MGKGTHFFDFLSGVVLFFFFFFTSEPLPAACGGFSTDFRDGCFRFFGIPSPLPRPGKKIPAKIGRFLPVVSDASRASTKSRLFVADLVRSDRSCIDHSPVKRKVFTQRTRRTRRTRRNRANLRDPHLQNIASRLRYAATLDTWIRRLAELTSASSAASACKSWFFG